MEAGLEKKETLLRVSSSPHIRTDESISRIMWTVILSLTPATAFAVYHFGMPAFRTILISIVSALVFEYCVLKLRKKIITINDGSAFLTGLLMSLCLPPDIPFYMPIAGSFTAIVIAKHSMGGLGYNIFNPAHIGRAALMVSWPIAMTAWSGMQSKVDGITSATLLSTFKQQGYSKVIDIFGSRPLMYKEMFLGVRNGSIGETSIVLLLVGGLFLIYKKYINWEVPVFMIGTTGLITFVLGPDGFFTGDPLFHMMAGGLFLGSFFMATDMVTIPITKKGQIIFAIGAGAITSLIRLKGGYPEGVCYSILLMNCVTPLIDRLVQPKKFGTSGTWRVK